MNDFVAPVLGWRLVLPLGLFACIVFFGWKWWSRRAAVLAIVCTLVAMVTTVACIASRTVRYMASIVGESRKADGEWRYWGGHLEVKRCAFRLEVRATDDPHRWPHQSKIMFFWGYGRHDGAYPIGGNQFSVTKSDFIQKTLGFQICWGSAPDDPGHTTVVRCYSMTVPCWFVLMLCVPFPLIWVRNYRRIRYRRRHHLCSACGYDLRASPGKCPECGQAVAAAGETGAGDATP